MLFNEGEQGAHDLHLGDGDDLIEIAAAEFECQISGGAYGTAVCNRVGRGEGDRASAGECRLHAGSIFRLHTDDLYLRIDELHRECNARGKAAAADGDENGIYVLERVDDLERNSALSDEYITVIERMDVDIAFFLLQLEAVRISIVESVAVEDHCRTECACRLDFEDRGRGGHTDYGVYTEFLRSISNALRVVARRGGNDAARLFLFREHGDAVVCTA